MSQLKKKRQRLSRQERRAQIIEAALNLFAQKGFTGARTREIAAEAGISETLIFQHFKTKEDLYYQALSSLFGGHPVMPELSEKMAQKDDYGVFYTLARHVIKHSREDSRAIRLAMFAGLEGLTRAESRRKPVKDGGRAPGPALAEYIRKRVREGAFRKVNPRIAARLFMETVVMYATDQELYICGPPLPYPDKQAVETLVEIFLGGLQASTRA